MSLEPCAKGLLGPRCSPVITREYTLIFTVRSMSPGCRKSGSANGSPSEVLRTVAIGTDGWSVMTVGIINTSTSVSSPDVHDECNSIDLIAVVVIPPLKF